MLRADTVIPAGHWTGAPADTVVLDFDGRYRRRIGMIGSGGLQFLLDLEEAVTLSGGDGLRLEDGRIVEVLAEPEPLLEIRGDPAMLARIAWRLGDRHVLTEIRPKALRIRRDSVVEAVAKGLGARVAALEAPFNPEGGAYVKAEGGAEPHDHASHDHGHAHSHAHDHAHHGHDHDHHDHDHDHDNHHHHDHEHGAGHGHGGGRG